MTSEFISIQTRLALVPMPAHHGWGHLAMTVASRTDVPTNDVPLLTVGVGHAPAGSLPETGTEHSHSPRAPRRGRRPSFSLQAAAAFAPPLRAALDPPLRKIGFETLAFLFGVNLVALPDRSEARTGCLKRAADRGQATQRNDAIRLPRPTGGTRKRTRY